MPTKHILLTERHEALIEALVRSGRYHDASDVLREGLRLVEEREAAESEKLQALREAAHHGELALAHEGARRFESVTELAAHLEALRFKAIAGMNG